MPRLKTLYKRLMDKSAQQAERVVFAGDGSGGNIASSLVIWVLEPDGQSSAQDVRVPAAIVAISPSTDLRHARPDLGSVAQLDPIMKGIGWMFMGLSEL
ncbi:hypothetical protein HIM_09232 [Hirsutella minnesotensis 3608]|uniref:Alpha/beta hydrolase fold-3 domain-containing protein n=1 Tax=Hirsutella minnesotensis 3608 TaxID=1043627 RepID=A0A0F7ZGS3_9HYPO|nr:hypothetical protein HIM_09232 [Hirsutella minnesotensis 3608]